MISIIGAALLLDKTPDALRSMLNRKNKQARATYRQLFKAEKRGRDWFVCPDAVEDYARTRRKK